jgi:hypothetical protein
MPSTYLTPTRRDLLIAVHEGRVLEGITEETDGHTWLVEMCFNPRKVDSRVAEAQRAGWVELEPNGMVWALTAGGRTALGWDEVPE